MRNSILKVAVATVLLLAFNVVSAQQPPSIVQVAEVVRTEITPTVSVPGTIFSRNDVQITAGVAGQLEMVAEPGTVATLASWIKNLENSSEVESPILSMQPETLGKT